MGHRGAIAYYGIVPDVAVRDADVLPDPAPPANDAPGNGASRLDCGSPPDCRLCDLGPPLGYDVVLDVAAVFYSPVGLAVHHVAVRHKGECPPLEHILADAVVHLEVAGAGRVSVLQDLGVQHLSVQLPILQHAVKEIFPRQLVVEAF